MFYYKIQIHTPEHGPPLFPSPPSSSGFIWSACVSNFTNHTQLTDFGMSVKAERVEGFSGLVPIKWLAPETITLRIHTTKSDVWMFAVCCWEILSLGAKPFADLDNNDILQAIESGLRLQLPSGCPHALYEVMRECWNYESHFRPDFPCIHEEMNVVLREQAPWLFPDPAPPRRFSLSKLQQRNTLSEKKKFNPFSKNPVRAW